jgi:hypothetical protein
VADAGWTGDGTALRGRGGLGQHRAERRPGGRRTKQSQAEPGGVGQRRPGGGSKN